MMGCVNWVKWGCIKGSEVSDFEILACTDTSYATPILLSVEMVVERI